MTVQTIYFAEASSEVRYTNSLKQEMKDSVGKPVDEGATDLSEIVLGNGKLSTDELEQRVETKLHGFEEGFRQKHPFLFFATLITPILLLVGAVGVCWWVRGWEFTAKLVGAAVATFFVLGRFVILFGQQPHEATAAILDKFSFLTPGELFLMVTYLDVSVALLVAFHIGALFRLPWLGKRVASLVEDARFVLESLPWMRRLTFTGLTLFVAFPLAATGAVGGSILGTLLGLSRTAVFAGTILGCLIGNGVLYFAAEQVSRYIDTNSPVIKFGGIAVILALIIVMEIRYKRSKKKFIATHK
jgi:uncharacterized membrane protein